MDKNSIIDACRRILDAVSWPTGMRYTITWPADEPLTVTVQAVAGAVTDAAYEAACESVDLSPAGPELVDGGNTGGPTLDAYGTTWVGEWSTWAMPNARQASA